MPLARYGAPRVKNALVLSAGLLVLGLVFATGCGDETTQPTGKAVCSDASGTICTWAGTGRAAFDGGGHALLESSFYWPCDLMFTSTGVAYIMDWNNHQVRKLTDTGVLETVLGKNSFPGDGPEEELNDFVRPGVPGTECYLNHPTDIIELASGKLLLTAWHNHKLREFDPDTGYEVVTSGRGAGFDGDGGDLKDALFSQPAQTVQSSDGSLFVLDQRNQRIRKISPEGIVSTVAGTGTKGYSGDNGAPLMATFRFPDGPNPPNFPGITVDAQDRLYVSDLNNHAVRRIDLAQNLIETVVGTGDAGFSGDSGPGNQTQINTPRDLEIGPDGRLYIADELNNRIRAYDPATGMVTTVAGSGTEVQNAGTGQLVPGYDGDGGPATEAGLNRPQGITFDSLDRMYIADSYNHVIRRVNP